MKIICADVEKHCMRIEQNFQRLKLHMLLLEHHNRNCFISLKIKYFLESQHKLIIGSLESYYGSLG